MAYSRYDKLIKRKKERQRRKHERNRGNDEIKDQSCDSIALTRMGEGEKKTLKCKIKTKSFLFLFQMLFDPADSTLDTIEQHKVRFKLKKNPLHT